MRFLSLTLPTLLENIALDEALLDEAELARNPLETMRIWEWSTPAVVIGRSSRIAEEVNLSFCESHGIPIFRRSSGGCAVVIGAGCLLYSVVLSYELHPALRVLDHAHAFISERLIQAVQNCGCSVTSAGVCDLTWHNRKFSGNSLRCKSQHLLYHGTILYNADLSLLANCLATPPREPAYRASRSHADFITNLPIDARILTRHLQAAFTVQTTTSIIPTTVLQELLQKKYLLESWHRER